MIICPKTDDKLTGYTILKPYITEALEIQLLDVNLQTLKKLLAQLILENKKLKYITLHLPMSICNIEDILIGDSVLYYIHTLIYICTECALENYIQINILAHCRTSLNDILKHGNVPKLEGMLNLFEDSKAKILLENDVAMSYSIRDMDPAYQVVSRLNNDHLRMCLDISHLHLQNVLFNRLDTSYKNYFNNEEIGYFVDQIHFSSALNNGVVVNLKNHGKVHNNIDFKADYDILSDLKLTNKIIVTEIIGTEEEYIHRTGQLKEIKLLQGV